MEEQMTIAQYDELVRKAAVADMLLDDIAHRANCYSGYTLAEVAMLRDLLARDRIPQEVAE